MQGLRARLCALAAQRLRMPLAAKKGAAKDRGPAKTGQLSLQSATGVGIRKGETDPPILPDDQYPSWLFQLMEPEPSVQELQRLYERDGEGLTLQQMRRLFRYKNKMRIREANNARAKK